METKVVTKQGAVQGLLSQDGRTVIFRGVPYAQPPVGELRFRRPQAHQPWEGVRDCTQFGPRCPQADLASMDFYGREFYDDLVPPEDEDCLYLNIWTPAEAGPASKLPVLFWIHGGAFMHGCSSEKEFDGEGFARKGVILVSVNYRVNAFGFFAHPDLEAETEEKVSGNYGILDQTFALRWVKENIAAFGGDPEKVTIAGQSAGCMSVQTIVSSPLSQGLLRGAILQSGGGLYAMKRCPTKEEVHATSRKLMEYLHVSTVAELRRMPAAQLRDAAYAVQGPDLSWRPHVDGWLLPAHVDAQAEAGAIHDIAYMIGSTAKDIGQGRQLQEAGARWCQNLLDLGRKPGYFYYFTRSLPGDDAGAFHSCELWYEFETMDRCWRPWEDCDRELCRCLSGYWANFAKTGDPNGEGLPRWEPYTDGCHAPMELGETVGMMP